jgi:hypothetical protein
MGQTEYSISGLEYNVEELEHSDKDIKKIRKNGWKMQDLWDTIKRPKLWIVDLEEGEKVWTKSIVNIFNKIVTEIFLNLEKKIAT